LLLLVLQAILSGRWGAEGAGGAGEAEGAGGAGGAEEAGGAGGAEEAGGEIYYIILGVPLHWLSSLQSSAPCLLPPASCLLPSKHWLNGRFPHW